MNLYFLVEGDRTEPRVYREWLKHALPHLTAVEHLWEVKSDNYIIFKGGGYPSYVRRIKNSLADIEEHSSIDHFFVCIDSEEKTREERFAEVQSIIADAETATRVRARIPHLRCHVIVQHCCLETWFLGHTKLLRRNPTSTRLVEMKRFYDVSTDDPEQLGRPEGYLTKASFHLAYLQEMLREHGKSYTKCSPESSRNRITCRLSGIAARRRDTSQV